MPASAARGRAGVVASASMRSVRPWTVLLLAVAAAAAACRVAGGDVQAGAARPCAHSGSLETTLDPLVRWFGEGAGRTRFLTLLSST